ncbi:MAG: methyltransferase [Lachnospiraceae bacterium]|nr:methyltransferase [Lachnospiraceae bacterium]
MVLDILEELKRSEEKRPLLIQLRERLRGAEGAKERMRLLEELEQTEAVLLGLFASEDAKVRKNLALILGELAVPKHRQLLWEKYLLEETRFVRGAYLEALKHFDIKELAKELKAELARLQEIELNDENRKHLAEEKTLLRELLQRVEAEKPHRFTGKGIVSDLILTTNRNHKHVVIEELGMRKKKAFAAGVMVQTEDPAALYELRTFEELFFVLPGCFQVAEDPVQAAEQLAKAGIYSYLKRRHEENGRPFVFRIELRGDMPLEKRSAFTKKMAAALEEQTKGGLVNLVSGYEVELRMVQSKERGWYVMIKLLTLKDHRFAYRRRTISAGIRPVNAALCMALAEEYLTENARCLDPFCGTGTMLVERAKKKKVKELYGTDILEEAVLGARENTKLAGVDANFIHRDFLTFTHEQQFDEIITDMPFVTLEAKEKQKELEQLYRSFFDKAPEHLKPNGIMILYTHDRPLAKRYAAGKFVLEKEYELSMREGSYLYILKSVK